MEGETTMMLSSLLGGVKDIWKTNRWTKKREVGHVEGIAKGAAYNKAMLRLFARSKRPDWGRPI
jgi:hypothetical protein